MITNDNNKLHVSVCIQTSSLKKLKHNSIFLQSTTQVVQEQFHCINSTVILTKFHAKEEHFHNVIDLQ